MSFFVEAPGEEPQVLTEVPGGYVQEKCGNCKESESDCMDPISGETLEGNDAVWKLPNTATGLGTCLTKQTIIQALKYSKDEEGHTFVSPFDPSKLIKLTPEQINSGTFNYVETAEDKKRKWEDADVENLNPARLTGYLNWAVEQFPPVNQGLIVIVNDTRERATSRFLKLFLSDEENESMWARLEKNTKHKVMYLLLEYSNLSQAVDIKEVAKVFQTRTVKEYIKNQMSSEEIVSSILVPLSSYATDETYVNILKRLLQVFSPETKGSLILHFDEKGIPQVKKISRLVWEANVLPPWSLATLLYGNELKYDDYLHAKETSERKRRLAFKNRWRDLARLGFRPPF